MEGESETFAQRERERARERERERVGNNDPPEIERVWNARRGGERGIDTRTEVEKRERERAISHK